MRILFVGTAQFQAKEETKLIKNPVVFPVKRNPRHQVRQPFFDPMIPILVIIEFARNVIRQVVGLELPNLDKVWLQGNQCLSGSTHPVPLLFQFGFLNAFP